MITRKSVGGAFFLMALFCSAMSAIAQENSPAPNIIFILADDFGYGSTNAYGADPEFVRTPHINRIAEKGMRFTDASTPACFAGWKLEIY